MEVPVQPGDTLAGKYRVDRVLGIGGMGVVVAAFDLLLERRVAIKFLLTAGRQNPEVLARFAREARSAARIESEHVARVIDVGALPDGAPYMVMEYLDGQDLSRRVSDHGVVPVEEAVDYVLQACEAIAEAHALGIVHRDLKPANLFLTRRADGTNFVKVLDFGISKAGVREGSEPDMSLTKTSAVLGSPLYMAPEQMRSTRQVDRRADVWALGVILFELVSGRVPFEATSMTELCALVLMEAAPALRDFSPHVPLGLSEVVARCLQKNPAERFDNVSELANALAPFGPVSARTSIQRISRVLRAAGMSTGEPPVPVEQTGSAPAVVVTETEARAGASTNANWSPSSTAGARRSSAPLGAIILAGVVVAAAGGALMLRGRAGAEPSTSPSALLPSSVAAAATVAVTPSAAASPEITPMPVPVAPSSESAPSVVPSVAAFNTPAPGRPALSQKGSKPAAPAAAPAAAAAPAPQPAGPAPAPQPAAAPAPAKKKNPLEIGLK